MTPETKNMLKNAQAANRIALDALMANCNTEMLVLINVSIVNTLLNLIIKDTEV